MATLFSTLFGIDSFTVSCLHNFFKAITDFFATGDIFKKITSVTVAVEMLGAIFMGYPTTPNGDAVDMSKFELVWSDEFDGDCLNEDEWEGHCFNLNGSSPTIRRGGYWCKDTVFVSDGLLKIRTGYYPDGLCGGPAGFYSAGIQTKYTQTYGYFECRCILPRGVDIWAAFWMYCPGVCLVNGDGKDGTEIDIFESLHYDEKRNNCVSSNLHYDGYGDEHRGENVGKFYVNDPYEDFNTYGLEWNENEYIFYINGIQAGRSSFGGVSRVPELMILSTEVGGEGHNAIPSQKLLCDENSKLLPSDFVVDYVRAYQYK